VNTVSTLITGSRARRGIRRLSISMTAVFAGAFWPVIDIHRFRGRQAAAVAWLGGQHDASWWVRAAVDEERRCATPTGMR
jgi:hypothetical protein